MKKHILSILLLTFLALMFTSCGKEAFNPICGKWRGYYTNGSGNLTYEFKTDGTFTEISTRDNKLWSGTFSTSGNILTLYYEKVTYSDGREYKATGATVQSVTYSVAGNTLTLGNSTFGKI